MTSLNFEEKNKNEAGKKALSSDLKKTLAEIASSIRILSMDAVQKANSGHPGLPLGCAELGAYLFGMVLKHNPKNSSWANRDRFVLSAGHGSMWLYSLLYLSGFNLSLEDIKNFRQLHSKTPGHPEYGDTDGVETTTGPLGQGIGNAVGQALGIKLLENKFNKDSYKIFDAKVYCLMGDGDMMEGVSSEVSSFAGNLQINNLVAIYDANKICLDGPISESFSDNVKERYESYGWKVYEINGHDFDEIHSVFTLINKGQDRPVLIIAHTIIGKGSPNKAGTSKVHGSPLGAEELKLTKEALGLPLEPFYVYPSALEFFKNKLNDEEKTEKTWDEQLKKWSKDFPELYEEYKKMKERFIPENLEKELKALPIKSPIAGRNASHAVIQELAKVMPELYGGSADLSVSDMTMITAYPIVSRGSFKGRNIKYGVREFGMATIASGLTETGMILPFIGTFLTFSDYMRNAIRLASLMKLRVIYHFTHDSIFLGEDGPTHQPIEHYAALRAIPNLHFIRPADANEVKMAWMAALKYHGPTAFSLSRQNLPTLSETDVPYNEGMGRGAYILKREKKKPDFTLIATGSEVELALKVSEELEKMGKGVRVISMPCTQIFDSQDTAYKNSLLGGDIGKRVSIEAGVDLGWHKYIGIDGTAICMKSYGLSAPYEKLAEEFGFTVPAILKRIL